MSTTPDFPCRARGTCRLACCEVGVDRPLIPAAFVAIWFVRRGSPDPTVRPTGGLQVTRRRSGTGRPAVAEDGRVRRPLPEPAFEAPDSGRAAVSVPGTQFRAGWPQGIAPLGLPRIRTCPFRHTALHIMNSLRDG